MSSELILPNTKRNVTMHELTEKANRMFRTTQGLPDFGIANIKYLKLAVPTHASIPLHS